MDHQAGAIQWFEKHIHMEEARHHDMLTVIPLIGTGFGGPDFCSLREGIENGLRITEFGEEGTVPKLLAINETQRNVLILDGEELAGAKQNRVLNVTVLIPAGATVELPVSCTEQGRWHWKSSAFMDSNVVMTPGMRTRKNTAVEHNLKHRGRYESDQSDIWNSIHGFARTHRASSPTMAMKDAFEAKRKDMRTFLEAIPCLPDQCGMLSLIKGNVVNLEIIANASVYKGLHEKLIGSLVMDIPLWEPASDPTSLDRIAVFLKHVRNCKALIYPAVGMGQDVRFRGYHLIGSALRVEQDYVHMAFFHQSRKYHARPRRPHGIDSSGGTHLH